MSSSAPNTMDSGRPLGVLVSAAVLSPSPSPLPSSPPGGRKHTVSPTSIFLLIGIWIFIVLLGCRLMFTMMGLLSNCFCCCCAVGPSRGRGPRRATEGEMVSVEQHMRRRARRRGDGGYDTPMAGFHAHTRTVSDATIQTFPVRSYKLLEAPLPQPPPSSATLPLYTTPPSTPPPGSSPPSARPATPPTSAKPSAIHPHQGPPRSPTPQPHSRAATPTHPPRDHTTIHIRDDASPAPRPDTAPLRDTSPPPSHRRAHSLDIEASTSHPTAPQLGPSQADDSRASKLYTVAAPERISTSTGAGAGSGEGLRVGGRPPGGDLAPGPSTGVLAQLGAGLDWLRFRATPPPAATTPEPASTPPPTDGMACPICLAEYAEGDQLRTLPCKHEFHVECVDPWMAAHPTCPICRDDLLQYEVADGQDVRQPQPPPV